MKISAAMIKVGVELGSERLDGDWLRRKPGAVLTFFRQAGFWEAFDGLPQSRSIPVF
jgi:hypothetical protein